MGLTEGSEGTEEGVVETLDWVSVEEQIDSASERAPWMV